jgi:hypothetical protein
MLSAEEAACHNAGKKCFIISFRWEKQLDMLHAIEADKMPTGKEASR